MRVFKGIEKLAHAHFRRRREIAFRCAGQVTDNRKPETGEFVSSDFDWLDWTRGGRSERRETCAAANRLRLLHCRGGNHSGCLSTGSISTEIPGRVMAESTLSCWLWVTSASNWMTCL